MARVFCGSASEPLYPGDQTDRLFMYTCTVGTCEMRKMVTRMCLPSSVNGLRPWRP